MHKLPRVTRRDVVILCLFLLLASVALLSIFTIRTGLTHSSSVCARSFPQGRVLELPIRCRANRGAYLSFGATYFTTTLPFSRLCAIAQDTCGEAAVDLSRSGQALIHLDGGHGAEQFYLLERCTQEDTFLFSGMAADLGRTDAQGQLHLRQVLLPLFLFDDDRLSGHLLPRLYEEAEYQLCLPTGPDAPEREALLVRLEEQFSAFYQAAGYSPRSAAGGGLLLPDGETLWRFTFLIHQGVPFVTVSSAA